MMRAPTDTSDETFVWLCLALGFEAVTSAGVLSKQMIFTGFGDDDERDPSDGDVAEQLMGSSGRPDVDGSYSDCGAMLITVRRS